MRLTEDIYLVGSAEFGLSNAYDCHVYLLDGGEEATLIDCGVGYDTGQIIRNIEKYIDIEKVKKVYLTHLHADHCGGGRDLQELGIEIVAPRNEWEDMQAHPDEVREAYEISRNSGCYPEGKEFIFPNPDVYVTYGEELKVGKYTLRCIELRGHSAGLMAYFLDDGSTRDHGWP